MFRKAVRHRLLPLSAALLVISAIAAVAVYNAVGGGHTGVAPENVSALHSSGTRLAGVPDASRYLGASVAPNAGEAHRLGYGAVGWTHGGQVCWAADHATGCDGDLTNPIDVTVGDSDAIGSGAPSRVLGLATDAVTSVTVTLKDGRSVSGSPISNFYFLQLPADAKPWDVRSVDADLVGGGSYHNELDIAPPPTAG